MSAAADRTRRLLLCDHLDPDAAEVAGDYTALYPAILEPFGLEFEVFDITAGRFPASITDFDGWLTTGSRRSAHRGRRMDPRPDRPDPGLAATERPHVGICFGHQLIARALGGRVATVGWGIGARSFDLRSTGAVDGR